MTRTLVSRLLLLSLLILLVAGCNRAEEPTPAPTFGPPTATATTTPPPLPPPTNTPEPLPTNTPAPVATPLPVASDTPTATPVPSVTVRVWDDAGNPIAGATVNLSNAATGFAGSFATTEEGRAIFLGVDLSTNTYLVEVSAPGYQTAATDITITQPTTEINITLEFGVTGRVTIRTNLRSGPGTDFDILTEIPEGETVVIIGVDNTGEWLQVVAPAGEQGWVFAELLEVQGDLSTIGGGTIPPSPTPGVLITVTVPAVTATPDPNATPTATPEPVTALPTRPAPIPFDATAMRAKMDDLEFVLVQTGGLLDRLALAGNGNCQEYLGYYAQIAAMPTYSEVPETWQGVYNEFQNVIQNALSTNEPTALFCIDGAIGQLSQFNYNLARNGINDSISLLFAVMAAADDLLGQ